MKPRALLAALLPRTLLTLVVALAGATPALAGGTIDATTYLPVGAFDAWEMIDKALWADGAGIEDEPQIVSVTNTFVVGGVPRHNVRTSFFQNVKDVIFQLGIEDGVVYLYGVRVLDPDADLGVEDLSLPTVFFDEPVPIGDTDTPLDSVFAVTPVTAKIKVELDLGPASISGNVFIDGTVTSRWNTAAPILTPLGTLGGGAEPLAELELDFLFTYSSDDDDIDDELQGVVTDKGVSAVLGPDIGFVQIDGQGSQQKIINRAILPGELVSNPAEPDAFPAVPAGDLLAFSLDVPDVVSLDAAVSTLGDGSVTVTDGVVTLEEVQLEHTLSGALLLTAQVSAGGAGPEDLELVGKAKPNLATGGLKVTLKGKTKKLADFAKTVKFSLNQELPAPLGAPATLDIVYNAGKDPDTLELITGTLSVPVTPFVGTSVGVTVILPVDVPKVKADLLVVNPAKRNLGAEGVLILDASSLADGSAKLFPVLLRETATVKDGLPTTRTYKLYQTGTSPKLFSGAATSTSPADFALTKLTGKLVGVKISPPIEDVAVTSQ